MKKNRIIINMILLVIGHYHLVNAEIPITEKNALKDLFINTQGVELECDGFSFYCNYEGTHVNEINLNSSNNIRSDILPSIQFLTDLVKLSLCSNSITSIPSEIGNLHHLNVLSLESNQLNSLPQGIQNLTQLEELSLSYNPMNVLPDSIFNLVNLTHLSLTGIKIESISNQISNLTQLTQLILNENSLTELSKEIGQLKNLDRLYLQKNALTQLPSEIGNLTRLTRLYLQGNKLKTLPIEITSLTKIRSSSTTFSYNALDISNTDIIAFLDSKCSGWKGTQTVAPKNLTITSIGNDSVTISWEPIDYVENDGGYEIFLSQASNDSYTVFDKTSNKTMNTFSLSGLYPGEINYCKVRTVTNPHQNNFNFVYSDFSNEILIQTGPRIIIKYPRPDSISQQNSATFWTGGPDIIHCKYKLDNEEHYSEPVSIDQRIVFENLADGEHVFYAIGQHSDGTWQHENFPTKWTWSVDTSANPPQNLALSSNSDSGSLSDDRITSITTVTITGMCEKNASIQLINNHDILENIVSNDHWFSATIDLSEGVYTITAIQTDAAGNRSASSEPLFITIDTTPPDLTIRKPEDDCIWLSPDTPFSIFGTSEAHAQIDVICDKDVTISTFQKTGTAWESEIIAVNQGIYTFWVTATDKAGNFVQDNIILKRHFPFMAEIKTAQNAVFENHSDPIPITITIYNEQHQSICMSQAINITVSSGHVNSDSCQLLDQSMYCQFMPDQAPGVAEIVVYNHYKRLGSTDIIIKPLPIAKLAFGQSHIMLELNQASESIQLLAQDNLSNTVSTDVNEHIHFHSTAGKNGAFKILSSDWETEDSYDELSSENYPLLMKYRCSVPGLYTIIASEYPEKGYADAQLFVEVIELPEAQLIHAPQGRISTNSMTIPVTGTYLTAYDYRLDQGQWYKDIDINIPIHLNQLPDGPHSLSVLGKNILGTVQEEASVCEWIVDTQIDPFRIDELPTSYCLWALEPGDITLSGIREKGAIITASCPIASQLTVTYPDENQWRVELVDIPSGQYTAWIYATDLANNRASIETVINRPAPDYAIIQSSASHLIADNFSTLPLTISFYNVDAQEICAHMDVIVESDMGQMINQKIVSNDHFVCDLKAGKTFGISKIYVRYQTIILGEHVIEMVSGPADRLVFDESNLFQDVGKQGNDIHISFEDAYGHPTEMNKDINITLNSTAKDNGSFYFSNHDSWEWMDTQAIIHRNAGLSSIIFSYKANVPGQYTINASDDLNLKDATILIHVLPLPKAFVTNVPSPYTNATHFNFNVQGELLNRYQYQINEKEWAAESNINKPLILSDLPDGESVLRIIGENILGTWQEKTASTIYTWTVDTNINSPQDLRLPAAYDSGRFNNDRVTRLTNFHIKGGCEETASIYLFCNGEPVDQSVITIQDKTFDAEMNVSEDCKQITAIQKDAATNISEQSEPLLITIDKKPPTVTISVVKESNSGQPTQSNTWQWAANEPNCLFRYAIDQNPDWAGSGAFTQVTQAEKSGTFGTWYLHVQAQDSAGNHSLVKTVSAEFEKPMIEFINVRSEGYESENLIQLKLTLNRIVDRDVTVDYTIKESSSTAGEWSDFTLVNMCLEKICHETIVKGEKEGLIQLSIINDYTIEGNEIIVIELVSSNVTLGRRDTYEYTIMNDDDPGISIAPSNSLILTEGTAPKSLTMLLSSKPQQSVEIEIQYDSTQRIKITPTSLKLKSEQWNVPQVFTIETFNDTVYKGDEDLEIEFKVSNTLDDYYKDLSQKIWIHLQDDENPPLPPEISCPQSPSNKSSLDFSWDSGGGTNLFRTKFDNNTMPDTDSNMFKTSSVLNDGFHQFVVREFNEFTNNWSDDAICDIEIDTGKPCTDAQAVLNLNADSMTVDITYTYADIYADETCTCENPLFSGSGVQKVELWVAEPSDSGNKPYSRYQTDEGDQMDGHFEFPVKTEGRYRFITRAMDAAGNYEIDQLPDPENVYDSEIVFAENFSGYAILAVGAVGDEGLDAHTLSANNIYKHLINRHFGIMHQMNDPLDHIKYLNTHAQTGVDETQTAATYLTALEHAIKQWALQKMTRLPGPLYIILIDHGSPDHFYLGDNTTTVSSATLNQWISELENNLKPNTHEIVIVMDTCYSGSFMDELSASGRIIITSTAENEVSFRGPKTPSKGFVRDGAFFASNLFNELSKGLSLSESFAKATYLTEMLTSSSIIKPCFPFYDTAAQHPLIDDDSNNEGHNDMYIYGDGFNSDHIYLGFAKTATNPVEIDHVEILPHSSLDMNEQHIDFKVFVSSPIEKDDVPQVCVEIKTPDTIMPTFVDDYHQKILNLHQICLEYKDSEKAFTGSYDQLIAPGKYTLYFYVENTDQIITYTNEICVYKKQTGNQPPVSFGLIRPLNINDPENSGSVEKELQQVIFEWEGTRDPENNQFSYTLFLSKSSQFDPDSRLTIIKENIIHNQLLIELPGNPGWTWDDSDIYWKVRAIDEYGAYTDTQTFMFKTDYVNSPYSESSVVFVHVYDDITKLPIPGATLSFVSDTNSVNLTLCKSGRYIEKFNEAGHYQVTIQAEGYETANESVDITENINIPFNFGISYTVQTGDLNRNRTIDIGDAIMCLQVLSGIQVNDFYYDEAARIVNDVGLRDAILIVRKMGFTDL
jgi:hypothetical protein